MTEEEKDFQYIREYINGSEQALNLIIRKYSLKIYWHARRMLGNHLDADEVTQEVLIIIYEKLKTFKFKSSLYTWIYRITANRSINYLRKRRLKNIFSIDDASNLVSDTENEIILGVENREEIQNISKILMRIPAKQREVFILRHFDEMSYEEISEVTGKSIGGLKANYFHALKKILLLSKQNNLTKTK